MCEKPRYVQQTDFNQWIWTSIINEWPYKVKHCMTFQIKPWGQRSFPPLSRKTANGRFLFNHPSPLLLKMAIPKWENFPTFWRPIFRSREYRPSTMSVCDWRWFPSSIKADPVWIFWVLFSGSESLSKDLFFTKLRLCKIYKSEKIGYQLSLSNQNNGKNVFLHDRKYITKGTMWPDF